ncbi:MAG: hypothetical protein WAW17_05385 [Rhodococcus sp. (in: high G+C Gram-positive bacteria)]|uniref:hypothetical protein n=1 Tax=Rhodococcus sp. TaxID=1831 RepID=UPI003BB110C0
MSIRETAASGAGVARLAIDAGLALSVVGADILHRALTREVGPVGDPGPTDASISMTPVKRPKAASV